MLPVLAGMYLTFERRSIRSCMFLALTWVRFKSRILNMEWTALSIFLNVRDNTSTQETPNVSYAIKTW